LVLKPLVSCANFVHVSITFRLMSPLDTWQYPPFLPPPPPPPPAPPPPPPPPAALADALSSSWPRQRRWPGNLLLTSGTLWIMCHFICKSLVQNLHLMRISKTNIIVPRIIGAGGSKIIQRKGNVLSCLVCWNRQVNRDTWKIHNDTATGSILSVLITYVVQTCHGILGFNCHEMAQGTSFFLT